MFRMERIIETKAAPETVFDFLADARNDNVWNGSERIEKVSDGPVGPSTRFREVTKMMGRETAFIFENARYEPPRLVQRYGRDQMMSFRTTWSVEPASDGSTLTFLGELEPSGPVMAVLFPLLRGMMTRRMDGFIPKLRAALDARV
jgi:polyketide cyclase/dehydrase/lipid transport protein